MTANTNFEKFAAASSDGLTLFILDDKRYRERDSVFYGSFQPLSEPSFVLTVKLDDNPVSENLLSPSICSVFYFLLLCKITANYNKIAKVYHSFEHSLAEYKKLGLFEEKKEINILSFSYCKSSPCPL